MRFYGGDPDDVEVIDVTGKVTIPGAGAQAVMFVAVVHKAYEVEGLPEPLPLCWWREGLTRPEAATVEDWAVSFDHGAVPKWCAAGELELITCQECRELIHS